MSTWTVAPEPFDSALAGELWRDYYTEVSDRWFLHHENRRTPPAELAAGIASETGGELAPPTGTLLVARCDGHPAGSAGVHLLDADTAELKRVFVREAWRGRGGGAVLLAAVEAAARELGARRIVLDTRNDLVEARALYARHGYTETEPHNDEQYAEHWFRKELTETAGAGA